MKKYEITYIIHPDLEGSTAKITEKVKSTVEKSGGKVLNEESWGKKKFAYEIQKNSFGIYEFLLVEIEPSRVKETERALRLSEEVIRYLVVLAEERAGAKTSKEKTAGKDEKAKTVKKKPEEAKAKKIEGIKEAKKPKKTKAEKEKEEKERQKALDEKLQEIIGDE